jgi:hypothetical protein
VQALRSPRHDWPVLQRSPRNLYPVLSWFIPVAILSTVLLRTAGVPGVDLHGPLHRFGIMDPFCGGTRATFLLASGEFAAAAEYNPVVFPLALGLAGLILRLLLGVTAGIWYDVRVPRHLRWPLFAAFVLALVLLGIRQQAHAALLVQPWRGP